MLSQVAWPPSLTICSRSIYTDTTRCLAYVRPLHWILTLFTPILHMLQSHAHPAEGH